MQHGFAHLVEHRTVELDLPPLNFEFDFIVCLPSDAPFASSTPTTVQGSLFTRIVSPIGFSAPNNWSTMV
jgi:hypothetical protein